MPPQPQQQHHPQQPFRQRLRKRQEEEKTTAAAAAAAAAAATPSSRNSKNVISNTKGRRATGEGGAGREEEAGVGLSTPVRAAGVSYSSSVSRNQPPPSSTSLPFKRVLLAGHRAGPSTPVLGWKMFRSSPFHDTMSPANSKHQQQQQPVAGRRIAVSARKLAATLWELQEIPLLKGAESSKIRATATPQHQHQQLLQRNSSSKRTGQFFSPASSNVSQRVHRRTSIQQKFGEGARRHTHSSGQAAGAHSQVIRLLEKQTGAVTQRISAPSNNEIEGDNGAITNSVLDMKPIPGDTGHGPTTSSELLKVLNRIWSLEEQHTSSMSLVSALRAELDHARAQVQELLHDQKLHRKEMDSLTKRLADERAMWREQEQETVRAAVHPVNLELEDERRSKQRLEMLYRKVSRDLTEMKTTFGKALHDLEREKKARELVEDVCDELAREIGEDKAEVEELKRESAKVREEVEEERKMLQMAEVWREERVQMKLAEARLELEEKNAAVDRLRSELEAFLRTKRACDARNEGSHSTDKELERRRSVDSVHLHEARITGRNSIDSGYSNDVRIPGRSSVESVHLNEVRGGAHGVQEHHDDEGSADDDLHSIELNNDNFISNTGSSHWRYLQQEAESMGRRSIDRRAPAVDRVDRGKQPQGGKVQGLERTRSSQIDPGIAAMENKEKCEQWDYVADSHWIDRTIERGELRDWSRDKRFSAVGNNEVNSPWQSDQEEKQDHITVSARALGRNLQARTDTLVRSGSIPVEGTSSRPEADTTSDSYRNNATSRFKSLGSVKDLHTSSGLAHMQQAVNVTSSPTRQWNHYWSSPDPGSPRLGRTNKGATDMPKAVRDNSLKAKLLEAKLEGQQARLRAAKGL